MSFYCESCEERGEDAERLVDILTADNERLRYAIKLERGKTEKADEDNERLRRLLREAVDVVESCHDCLRYSGGDILARIDAALGTPADQPKDTGK